MLSKSSNSNELCFKCKTCFVALKKKSIKLPEIAKIAGINSLPFSTCEGQAWEMSRHSEFADWLHLLNIKFGFGSENTRGGGGNPSLIVCVY